MNEPVVMLFPLFYKSKKKRHIRAIRIRTVDLLGKTDQTDYYQNDPNCFKDPTCIFLHWARSLTDINISQSAIFFYWTKNKEMAPRALIHYLDFDPGALPKCFKKGLSWRRSASGLEQTRLNKVSIVLPKKQIWNFIHRKVHRTRRYSSEALRLIMPSIE